MSETTASNIDSATLLDLTAAETDRMAWWMEKYKDTPMDFAKSFTGDW